MLPWQASLRMKMRRFAVPTSRFCLILSWSIHRMCPLVPLRGHDTRGMQPLPRCAASCCDGLKMRCVRMRASGARVLTSRFCAEEAAGHHGALRYDRDRA